MTGLLRDVGSVEVTERTGEAIEVTVPLDADLAGDPALRRVLRAVATSPIEIAEAPGEAESPSGPGAAR